MNSARKCRWPYSRDPVHVLDLAFFLPAVLRQRSRSRY